MDPLTRKDVDDTARLAKLSLEDDEAERLRAELSQILEHMETLRAVDTEGVTPMTHAVPMALRLRPDAVEPSLPPGEATRQAPDRADDCFQVPHIIKSGAEGAR